MYEGHFFCHCMRREGTRTRSLPSEQAKNLAAWRVHQTTAGLKRWLKNHFPADPTVSPSPSCWSPWHFLGRLPPRAEFMTALKKRLRFQWLEPRSPPSGSWKQALMTQAFFGMGYCVSSWSRYSQGSSTVHGSEFLLLNNISWKASI